MDAPALTRARLLRVDPIAWAEAIAEMHARHVAELSALIHEIPDDPPGIPIADCHLTRIADAASEMLANVEDAFDRVAWARRKTERRLAETTVPADVDARRQHAYPGRF